MSLCSKEDEEFMIEAVKRIMARNKKNRERMERLFPTESAPRVEGDNEYKEKLERKLVQKVDDDWWKDYRTSRGGV